MLEKLRKEFHKMIVGDEEYRYVLDEICENNRKIIVILCSACILIFSLLLALGIFYDGFDVKNMPVFLFSLLYGAGILFLVRRNTKHSNKATMVATYLTIAAVMFYGLLISYRAPDQYTVTFIAMMAILCMTFVDKAIRLVTANVIATIFCIGMVYFHKSEAIRFSDSVNILSFSVLSIICGFFTVNMKMHGYAMDKLLEEDIEKGRQRLNAKEIEALQLLTAVKSTHDMVVSVNLTKNTYKLIGGESFVTHGDAITGNFNEVIDIHAGKVIEEHRQLYYDTFSREGLLKAHAEGKKEIYLEYQQRDEKGVPHWLGTHTMFIKDPHSTDVTEITISQNIDERVRREEEVKAILEEERDKAEQAQKAKTDFLFQMSHDIRTPMNAIIGFTNFIKASDDLYAIRNDYAAKLEIASQQLLMLINDALEMSRIESGKLEFQRETQDIRTIITNVMAVMQVQAEEKGVELTAEYAVDDAIVYCDKNHMSRVVMNLLSNAVKFTPAGGRVKVSLKEQPEAPEGYAAFELKVADTGIGMSPEFVERVFEPFEREQTSTVSGMQGTGLGMSIVERIVRAAGDSIHVESQQGEGTVFTINMTLLRGKAAELPHHQGVEGEAASMEQMVDYFKGRRILLAEDNEFNLIIAQTLLENVGFAVETAADGRVALEKIMDAPVSDYYDVVLMDIQMPVMDGYEAARAIRALPDGRAETTIIAVTANAFDTDRENAVAAGMNGHISKPIDVAVLYRTLRDIL